MGKKPAGNSTVSNSFGRIEIDPTIAGLVDRGEQIARAVQESKTVYCGRRCLSQESYGW